uniref:protein-tyrosine-phosphatase n=1 Tax=Sus scrofa TaxID=9823 RepID=A0A286ZQS0_PIG
PRDAVSMDSWFLLVLLGSGLIHAGASNTTTVSPSVGVTRSIKATTAESFKEETKTSNPTSSVTSPSLAPTFSPNLTLGPTYVTTTVNSSDSDNGTTRTVSTNSVVTTVSPNGTWHVDTRTEPWEGNASTAATTPETFPPSDETPIIAVMVALSSLLVIVFIIIVLYMLRFKKYKQAGSHSNSFRLSNGRTEDVEPQSVPLLARSPSTNRKYPPLPVDKLEEEINRRMADDNKLFREEFNALPACPIQATCEAASKEENKEKNRYVNILPCDPLHLLGCKCAQYWPDQGCWTYGNIRVSVEDVTVLVDYTVRKFCIQQVGDVTNRKPQRLITQFHFTSWPDFGVPFTPIGMLKFLKKVKACNPQYAGAIVVHCSAGVGRTGTFVVIDAMLDMMHTERKVDVYGFVSRIRAQRCQMVQTDMQYVFIYQALLEHYLYGDTELEVTSLETHLQKIYNKIPGTSNNGLEEEFKKLTSIKIQNDKMRTGNLPANMKKNRVLQIIPYEFNRVIIPVKRGEENTDYVNASFIDGYRQKDSYIASQGPLLHTIEDFWRMIWEWKSCSIVMLTELEERGQEKCAQYWPSDGLVSYGDITVELKKEEECESYTVRDLLVTNTRENKSRQIRQFHFHGWPEVGIPSDGKGMISIIAAVQKQQQQSGNHPITVHCRYAHPSPQGEERASHERQTVAVRKTLEEFPFWFHYANFK